MNKENELLKSLRTRLIEIYDISEAELDNYESALLDAQHQDWLDGAIKKHFNAQPTSLSANERYEAVGGVFLMKQPINRVYPSATFNTTDLQDGDILYVKRQAITKKAE